MTCHVFREDYRSPRHEHLAAEGTPSVATRAGRSRMCLAWRSTQLPNVGRSRSTCSSPPAGPSLTSARRSPTTIVGKYRVSSKTARRAETRDSRERVCAPRAPQVAITRAPPSTRETPVSAGSRYSRRTWSTRSRSFPRSDDRRAGVALGLGHGRAAKELVDQRAAALGVVEEGGVAAWDDLEARVG